MNKCFRPGQEWVDTEGNRIQAHGGSVIYVDNKYYWYGENKEKTLPDSGLWHWGVRLYSSDDMYNWRNEGIIVPPSDDYDSPLHPTQYMDRPHIIYNKKTNTFVMWIKIMRRENMGQQYMTIAVADKITDEFKIIKTVQPLGYSSGDFDLVVDEKTNKAYIYFDKVHDFVHLEHQHKDVVCAELTDDYTDLTGNYSNYHDNSPYRVGIEAPAFCKYDGKMYLFLSRTTGYVPNPTECLVSDNYFGPWERIGRVHEGDRENLSFRSQISSIFKHPKKNNLFVALADRWLMNLPDDLPDNLFEIANSQDDDRYETLHDKRYYEVLRLNNAKVRDMSVARYVWLPIFFENGRPVIRWFDEWKWEDFE